MKHVPLTSAVQSECTDGDGGKTRAEAHDRRTIRKENEPPWRGGRAPRSTMDQSSPQRHPTMTSLRTCSSWTRPPRVRWWRRSTQPASSGRLEVLFSHPRSDATEHRCSCRSGSEGPPMWSKRQPCSWQWLRAVSAHLHAALRCARLSHAAWRMGSSARKNQQGWREGVICVASVCSARCRL